MTVLLSSHGVDLVRHTAAESGQARPLYAVRVAGAEVYADTRLSRTREQFDHEIFVRQIGQVR